MESANPCTRISDARHPLYQTAPNAHAPANTRHPTAAYVPLTLSITTRYPPDALVAPHITDPCSVAERCADLELFRRLGDGYLIPDYLDFNPSRESVMAKRAAEAERQAKHRASQRDSRRDTDSTSDVSHSVPSRPVPSEELSPHPPTGSTGLPVDNPRIEEIISATVTARLAKQQSVRSPDAWKRTADKNLRADTEWLERVERLVSDYPEAPLDLLVNAADGDTSPNLRHYRTTQETA